MHGVDLDNCRLAVQPREIKFGLRLSSIESQPIETTGWRGTKSGAASRAHPTSSIHNFKTLDPTNYVGEDISRRAERAQTQYQPSLSFLHHTELCDKHENFSERNKATKTTSMRVARRVRGAMMLRKARKNLKPLRSPRVLTHSQPPTVPSLFVEGSSMLAQDAGYASQALKHLSDCVSEERNLRDALEKAKEIKLKAFRDVTRIYLTSLNTAYSPSATSSTKPSRSLVQHPDRVPLARCAVVSNTLLSTIQSYMRCRQSNQLIASLQWFRHLNSESNLISNSCINSFVGTQPGHEEIMSPNASRLSTSLEDLLDMEEINKLKQLYFDYFECEIVELDSTESSQLRDSQTSESMTASLASLLDISDTRNHVDGPD